MSDLPRGFGWLQAFRGTFTRHHVDFTQFSLLLRTKLILAQRTNTGIGLSLGNRRRPSQHPLRLAFFWNLLIGVLIGLICLIMPHLLSLVASFMTVLFIMFFLTMLTSYATMLLDPKDRLIFGTRGVNNWTLNAARLVLVGAFLGMTMLALAGPGLLAIGSRFGLFVSLATLISVALLAVFALVLALLFYLLVLRFFSGERLKNILNVVQIGLIVVIYVTGQLPNLLPHSITLAVTMPLHLVWWYVPAVPVWFAGLSLIAAGQLTPLAWLLTGLSIGVTLLLAVIYLRNAANFEQYLEKLDQSDARPRRNGWYFKLTRRLFTHSPTEATYFTLGWRMLQTERDYKLRVYPQQVYGVILPLVFVSMWLRDQPWQFTQHFVPYLSLGLSLGMPMAVLYLAYSHQPEAMAVFRYVPFADQGLLLRGVVKAVYARLYLPLFLVYGLISLLISGLASFFAVIATLVIGYTALLLFGRFVGPRALPFASEFTPAKAAEGGATTFSILLGGTILVMALIAIGGFGHNPLIDLALTVIAGVSGWVTARSYRTGIRYNMILN